jgi:hypothetical protein
MKHFITVKLERREHSFEHPEGVAYEPRQPDDEREKVDHEPGYIRPSVNERWRASCACGWQGEPHRRRNEARREGRRHGV